MCGDEGEENMRRAMLAAMGGLGLAALAAAGVRAQEVTLRAVSAFQEGTAFSRNFERFIERVNAAGAGQIRINYIGGTRAMPPFEVGNAVRGRVVDMANVTGAFYTNLMPEADGFKLATRTMAEQRRNGAWEFVNQLHNQRLNAWYLARQFQNVPFHFYFRARPQAIERLDFTGLKIRVTPVYRALVEALGGTAMQTAPGEVFTAMERGVVDGYGWPILGVFDLGWEQVTRFRLDPGFYNVDVNVLVNLDSWRRLSDRQRQILDEAALWLEGLDAENAGIIEAERARQAQANIQAIALPEADARRFLARASEVGWQAVIRQSPETGARLRQLIAE
jgi:TRAP-type C4-dicarboxylate transport system substrate-binding protein